MKLDSITYAIELWNEANDSPKLAYELLSQGVAFNINPKVLQCSSQVSTSKFIHAYPGIVDDHLCMFLINDVMDTPEAFDDVNNPITNYIFVAPIEGISESLCEVFLKQENQRQSNIDADEARARVARWSLSKEDFIKNQINNTEGLFEAFVIPATDIDPANQIHAFFAINPNTATSTADLIIWDYTQNRIATNLDSKFADVVLPCPPFGQEEETEKKKMHLLNISYYN
jgi:hypothetical protein